MNKKILLASGCSYTDPNFRSFDQSLKESEQGGWPMWPELVSNKLNLTCINLGEMGQCNTISVNKIIRALAENKDNVDTVMILLSGWDRSQLFNGHSVLPLHCIINIIDGKNDISRTPFFNIDNIQKGILEYIEKQNNFFLRFHEGSVNETLTSLYILIKLCEAQKIKFIIAQGVDRWHNSVADQLIKLFKNHSKVDFSKEYLKYLSSTVIGMELEKKSNHFIGWPFEKQLGGYSIDNLRFWSKSDGKGKFKNIPMGLCEQDWHPNEKEQEIIAEIFVEKYLQLYDHVI